MQKIVHFSSVHSPMDVRIFHKQVRTLADAGYEVVVVAPWSEQHAVVDGVRIVGLPQTRSRWGRPLNWMRLIRHALRERAALYHFHDPELLFVGLIIQWLTGSPVIYDAHEWYAGKILVRPWIPRWLRPLLSKIMARLEPALAQRLAATVTADHLTSEQFRMRGVQRVTVVYNFPLPGLCSPSPVKSDQHSRHHPTLVYVGLLGLERGLFTMLETVACLVHTMNLPVHLILIGGTRSPELLQCIQDNIDRLDIRAHVRLTGQVPHQELGRYLIQSDIGLLACNPEMFRLNIPTKLFEYMAAGLPIVATRADMISYFVESVDAGVLVDSQDPREYAEAIVQLHSDPGRFRQMARNGRHAFETEYNWEPQGRKLVALYRQIIGPTEA